MTASLHAGPRRSGTDIRATLAEHAPTELDTFDHEVHAALYVASTSFDTDPISDVLNRWWRLSVVRSIRLSDTEKDQLRRAQSGDSPECSSAAATAPFNALNDYPIIWVDFAEEQYLSLDDLASSELDAHLTDLASDPTALASYDPVSDHWRATPRCPTAGELPSTPRRLHRP